MGGKAPGEGPAAREAGRFAREVNTQARRPQRLFYQQLTEALKTGGVGARIPIIQRAVSDVQQGTQAALTRAGTTGALTQLGPGSDDRGLQLVSRQVRGTIAQQGAQAASRLPTQIAQQLYVRQAPTALGGAGESAATFGGVSTQAHADALRAAAAKQESIARALAGIAEMAGRVAGDPAVQPYVRKLWPF